MNDIAETPREVRVQLESAELGIANRRAAERLRRAAGGPRPVARFGIALAFGMVAALGYRSLENHREWWLYVPAFVFLLVACAAVGSGILFRRRLLARLDAAQSREFAVRLDDQGIELHGQSSRVSFPWSALEAVDTDPGGICLHFTGFHTVWIPSRAFADAGARGAFLARIETASGRRAGISARNQPAPIPTQDSGNGFWRDLANNLGAGALLLLFRPTGKDRVRGSVGQFIALMAAGFVVSLGSDLIQVGPRGTFDWSALPAFLYGIPWLLLTPWAASLGDRQRPILPGAVALAALWLPMDIAFQALHLSYEKGMVPEWLATQGTGYFLWLALFLWAMVASMAALVRVLGLPAEERMAAVLAVICVLILPSLVSQEESHLWTAKYDGNDRQDRADYERRVAPAREAALYAQSRLLDEALARIKPGRPGKPELFLLAVGGNGSQDVFRREVEAVRELFDERFATAGRSVVLLNNPETVLEKPLASVTALRRTLAALGKRMNRDEDVLLLFMTSHGSPKHQFDLSLWPYRFDELTPERLRALLDEAGIRYRVVVVSACYSGGFVPPLAGDDTLVISASRADRNSHGCSHEADWTFFGRAFFDEALRRTVSFETAFAEASHAIAEREKGEELPASEPQIAVGAGIRRALGRLEKYLAR